MVETKDSEPGAGAGSQLPAGGGAATGVEPGAPTCPRRRWCEWRREQPGQEHRFHHWHHWHHHVGPQHPGGAPADPKEWPPRDWQQWHERRWHGHCPWSRVRPTSAAGPRVPLDDSRWMEDYFSWY